LSNALIHLLRMVVSLAMWLWPFDQFAPVWLPAATKACGLAIQLVVAQAYSSRPLHLGLLF
jgi:hypothetical protein